MRPVVSMRSTIDAREPILHSQSRIIFPYRCLVFGTWSKDAAKKKSECLIEVIVSLDCQSVLGSKSICGLYARTIKASKRVRQNHLLTMTTSSTYRAAAMYFDRSPTRFSRAWTRRMLPSTRVEDEHSLDARRGRTHSSTCVKETSVRNPRRPPTPSRRARPGPPASSWP